MAKMNFKRDFAFAREIFLDQNVSFYAIFFEHNDLILYEYFMTLHDDFE